MYRYDWGYIFNISFNYIYCCMNSMVVMFMFKAAVTNRRIRTSCSTHEKGLQYLENFLHNVEATTMMSFSVRGSITTNNLEVFRKRFKSCITLSLYFLIGFLVKSSDPFEIENLLKDGS